MTGVEAWGKGCMTVKNQLANMMGQSNVELGPLLVIFASNQIIQGLFSPSLKESIKRSHANDRYRYLRQDLISFACRTRVDNVSFRLRPERVCLERVRKILQILQQIFAQSWF